ncbi:MAG: hypothetical protein Fur0015_10110 [Ignavibacteriales bacterium]
MDTNYHHFHIPVMGTGYSIDTPIRVGHYGISSVISIVDDLLIEKIRKYYCEKFNLAYEPIHRFEPDGRAKRITAYLNVVSEIVQRKIDELKNQPFFVQNDKSKYFELLPDDSPIKATYKKFIKMKDDFEKFHFADELNKLIHPGAIDVNIMTKIDKLNYDKTGQILSEEFSDAKAALRGFANSCLNSSVIFSAGFNRGLYGYISKFQDFFRDSSGELKKKITIKVSDFRSALIQGKFLASKGLEVSEFRIESGLNCGGHAFASQGYLLPTILKEFREKKELLTTQLKPVVKNFYAKMGWEYPDDTKVTEPLITVQGGVGTSGEAERLIEEYGCKSVGWGSPFLLVPEATCVDKETLELLMNAKKEDLYLSNASPLGVPFNNLRNTGSEIWTKEKSKKEKPGSSCPKGFLVYNKEFSEKAICTASTEFLNQKYKSISELEISSDEKETLKNAAAEKVCLCMHLGNSALIALGIQKNGVNPQAICPGPNVVWWNREYSLTEMVDHIYGRGESLVPKNRPHMFCQEVELYINYFEKLLKKSSDDKAEIEYLKTFKENLDAGMDYILEIARGKRYYNENIDTISTFIQEQKKKLDSMFKAELAA